jgi:hypothetical protein
MKRRKKYENQNFCKVHRFKYIFFWIFISTCVKRLKNEFLCPNKFSYFPRFNEHSKGVLCYAEKRGNFEIWISTWLFFSILFILFTRLCSQYMLDAWKIYRFDVKNIINSALRVVIRSNNSKVTNWLMSLKKI